MTPALTAFLSIGQGDTLTTPLQMCAMTACVANGGKYWQPRVVRKAVSEEGKTLIEDKPKLVVDLIEAGIEPADLELIRKGMSMAVNLPGGTAGKVRMPNIEVAAKTGTAQTVDNGEKSNNSWVISFAPYENPEYAICVLVQNGGSGGAVCGPLVNLIYHGLFPLEEGTRLPLRAQTEFVGNTERIEAIELPAEALAAYLPFVGPPAPDDDPGETGDEVGDLAAISESAAADDSVTPVPTITPEIDDEGTVIPRAVPVPEP
jgi:penicillin-binding protein 2